MKIRGAYKLATVNLVVLCVGLCFAASAQGDAKLITSWGTGTSGLPFDVAMGPAGTLFVADFYENRVEQYTPSGAFVNAFGDFQDAEAIAVGPGGDVYVASGHTIYRFAADGTFISQWGEIGEDPGTIRSAVAITTDPTGNVYIADSTLDRVTKFTAGGTYITSWGGSGEGDGDFVDASGVAVDPSGTVYVVDEDLHRVQKFTADGAFIGRWGKYGAGAGKLDSPAGIATDSDDHVFVSDTGNNRVEEFTADGEFLNSTLTGVGDPRESSPGGLDVGADGYVYVADHDIGRIDVFQFPPASPVTGPAGNPLGLPHPHGCVPRDEFSFRIRHAPGAHIVDVKAYVDRKLNVSEQGTNIKKLTLKHLPKGRFVVKVLATHDTGSQFVSKEAYKGCSKGGRHRHHVHR